MKTSVMFIVMCFIIIVSHSQTSKLKTISDFLDARQTSKAKALLSKLDDIESANDEIKLLFYFLKAKTYFQLSEENIDSKSNLLISAESLLSFVRLNELGINFKDKKNSNVLIKTVTNELVAEAIAAQNKKQFKNAADLLFLSYSLLPNNQDYLYFAASNSLASKDYDTALKHYKKLKDLGYTGTNVLRSRFPEIVKNIAWIYTNHVKDNEKALNAVNEAIAVSPDDYSLLMTKGTIYFSIGNTQKFLEIMNLITTKDPKNADAYYNIGAVNTELGNEEVAIKNYKKVLQIEPSYLNASINLSKLYLDKASIVVEKMQNLGMSKADNEKFDQFQKEQKSLYKKSTLILESALIYNHNNISLLKQLKGLYSFLGEDDKYKQVNAKLKELTGY